MKHQILNCVVFLSFCAFSMNVNAQLTVDNSGNVKLDKQLAIGTTQGTNTSLNIYKYVYGIVQPCYGVNSILSVGSSMPVGNSFALHGFTDASTYNGTSSGSYGRQMCGVVGEVTLKSGTNAANTFAAGVAGIVNTPQPNCGVGVLGAVKYSYAMPNNSLGLYAGYFNGPVYVTSSLTAQSFVTSSDARLKQNIENINLREAESAILRLRPVSYYFKQSVDSFLCMEDLNTKALEKQHYGLIAQEVKEVLPDLVYEKEGDYMAVNYIELIPLLIKEIQKLSAEVENLKNQQSASTPRKSASAHNAEETPAVLYQNNPNPFSVDTRIDYQLPQTTQSASLYIYDMNGSQILEYPIVSYGTGSVIVTAGRLEAGMYLYSLIADGQVIDTKRMILTK